MKEELLIGNNHVQIDGDTLHVTDSQGWGLAETQELCTRLADIRVRHGRVYLITDGKRGAQVSPEGRRAFAEWTRHNQLDAAVAYGVSVVGRAVLALIVRASQLTGGKRYPLTFVGTASDAQRHIDQHRQTHYPEK